jgi:hypothetical protein
MISTTQYGFLKPEDTDSADLRVFVGQNMDKIETSLINLPNSLPNATFTQKGLVKIGNGLNTNVDGYIFAKLGKGLEFDVGFNISAKVASATQAGIVQIGNGLGMSGDYIVFKDGDGLYLNQTTYTIDVDSTVIRQSTTGGTGLVSSLWSGTQAQYDQITKDSNTIYYIVG